MLLQKLLSAIKHSMKRAGDTCQTAAAAKIAREGDECLSVEPVITKRKPKHIRYALLLSYCGKEYFGMQTTSRPEYPTVESTLLTAFSNFDLHSVEDCRNPGKFKFQRAARTDKGVSAVRQIVSCNLGIDHKQPDEVENVKVGLNDILPEVIRVMGIKRVTKNFDSRWLADGRSYSYTLPTFAFAHFDQVTDESYRITSERIEEINDILSIFKGSHNFCNFSSGRTYKDASCLRYINECTCSEPFERLGLQFVTINLRGQSFILHQIRKMIAMVISIVRGYANKSFVQQAFEQEGVRLPIAPGLGLLLERVHYEKYDKKFKDSHASITFWPECEENISEFKEKFISPIVYETEKNSKSMFEWLKLLQIHYSEQNVQRNIPGVTDDDSEAEDLQDDVDNTLANSEEVSQIEETPPLLKKAMAN